ncbi:hypothetical protein [Aeromonas encheleia]|uniref:Secreted protein n=1 Tax=Aeromonas encheleia TaxID=73010 RepID=A0AAE9SC54_9GAMM|nr:hypothetical protein [Aeromonas encheleia]USV57743.1 hypothetical protein NHF51_00630 [Aeromonas encheleia]
MFNIPSLFRCLFCILTLSAFNPNISVAATQISSSGAHATMVSEEHIKELKDLIGKQERENNLLRSKLTTLMEHKEIDDFNSLKNEVKSISDERGYFSYADMAAVSISVVSVLITVLGIVVAILSFWGYRNIQKTVQAQAAHIAKTHAAEAVSLAIQDIASEELKKIIDEGNLNKHLQDAVDVILRSQRAVILSKTSQLLNEIDQEEGEHV